ncbi:MAG: FkbM family methyltransferase [Smithellaceae bacterium]|nr:FkbM family methyltransferase [Smithellaceae bacterium]
MSIKSYLYQSRPEIAVASEYYGAYRNFRKAGFKKTPFGFMMAGLESMQDGSYEYDETQKIIARLGNADVFIDVGANMGYYTCIARSMGLKVLAVEPLWHNLQFLYGNLEVNDWPDVEIFPLGLSNKPGLAVLYGVGTAASFIKDWAGISTKKRMVPLSTLDIIAANRFSGLRVVIKIDVEGVEYSVLQGAEMLLSCLPAPVWMMETGLTGNFPGGVNENFIKVFELFWSKGYSVYDMMPGGEDLVTEVQVREWVKNSDTEGKVNFLFRKNG